MDEERGDPVRQDVAPEDAPVRQAERNGRLHERPDGDADRLGTRHTRELWRERNGNSEHRVLQARAELGPAASLAMVTAASNESLLRLRANQLLISDGTNYRLALKLSQGELTLNGQSMHLPTF